MVGNMVRTRAAKVGFLGFWFYLFFLKNKKNKKGKNIVFFGFLIFSKNITQSTNQTVHSLFNDLW